MRKDFGVKTWLYPQPVLIIGSYGEDGTVDAMNAAWGGMYDSNKVVLCLSAGHATTKNLKERGGFTVSMGTAETVVACDYVGVVSANDVPNKMEKSGLTAVASEKVDAPLFAELPLALECTFAGTTPEGNIIGEIVNVSVDESIVSENGEGLDMEKFTPISFDPANAAYLAVKGKVGNAFSDGQQLA